MTIKKRNMTAPILAVVCAVAFLGQPANSVEETKADLPSRKIPSLIDQLQSPNDAQWRKAQICLAVLGVKALDGLDVMVREGNAEAKDRTRKILMLVMLRTVRWEHVKERKHLAGLVRAEISEGFEHAKGLANRTVLDIGKDALLPEGHKSQPTEIQKTLNAFIKLRGFGVPAALDLCANENPVARAYGILVLERMHATIAKDYVSRMERDFGRISVLGSDWGEHSHVGKRAQRFMSNQLEIDSTAMKIETYICDFRVLYKSPDTRYCDLINGIRQICHSRYKKDHPNGGDPDADEWWKVYNAKNWDRWWYDAQPAWNKWWELHGTGKKPAKREVWLNWVNLQSNSFTLQRKENPDGTSLLRVMEPKGSRCEIYHDGILVEKGPIPVETMKTPKTSTEIVVYFSDGGTWKRGFVPNTGYDFTIRVFRADPH